jgi:hypothetical protein
VVTTGALVVEDILLVAVQQVQRTLAEAAKVDRSLAAHSSVVAVVAV